MKTKIENISKVSLCVAALMALGTPSWGETTQVRLALGAGTDRVDPIVSVNGPDLDVIRQIYETLLWLDPQTGELQPRLASSYELVNPTTWRFKLRQDVKFTNGEPLNAEAVKFSIERVLDPAMASPNANGIASVARVEIVDEHTVDIVTKYPDMRLPRAMQAMGGAGRVFIVPPKYFAGNSAEVLASKPIGTGPYMLDAWNRGQSLTLVVNPNYWGKQPEIGKAIYHFIPEDSTRLNALLTGEVDLAQRIPIDKVDAVQKAHGVHVVAMKNSAMICTILLDMRAPPFDNIKARQAFAHAVDIESIVENLLKGYGVALPTPVAPSTLQYNAELKNYEYNPDLAKKLLKESGYDKKLVLDTKTSAGRYVADREIYQALNAQLREVGFNITPQNVEWGRLANLMAKRTAGPFYYVCWDYADGDLNKLNGLALSTSPVSVAIVPEYDALQEKARSATDPADNKKLWQEAQAVIHANYAFGGSWLPYALFGVSDKFEVDPTTMVGENMFLTAIKVK